MPSNTPALDNDWSHSAENSDGTVNVWMINRWISGNDVPNEWQGPWLISGANGENGIDGDTIEYIYTRSTETELSELVSNALNTNSQEDDYVPSGWHDNPQGVSATIPYEWMAFRVKTHSKQDPNGTWGNFIGPTLWSSYGRNGTDGDGIEYIFCAKPDGETYTSDPSTWEVSQEREYIANNEWKDDPVDIENLLQGARQWVSIRRKYADVEGEEPVWHAYSAPTLWSYYAKDGAVQAVLPAVQYSIQVTGSTVAVHYGEEDNTIVGTITYRIMRSEGSNISLVGSSNEYNVTTAVMLGGDTACPDITYSDGIYSVDIHNRYEGYENYTEIIAYENNIPVATTVVPTIIPGTNGSSEPGQPGQSTFMSTMFVRMNTEPIVPTTQGSYSNPSPSGCYADPDRTKQWQDGIPVGEEILWATTRIFTSDGLAPQQAQWQPARQMTDTTTYDVEFAFDSDDLDMRQIPPTITNTHGGAGQQYWFDPVLDADLSNNLYALDPYGNERTWADMVWRAERQKNNGEYVGEWVITRIKGEKGDPGDPGEVQALNLEVIRMRTYESGATPAYNNGTIVENGVKYLDIVEHNGNYYKCLRAGTTDIPGAAGNEANPGWTILTGMGNAWFDTMIANNAYIKSITTKQIVVTSDAHLDNNGDVVEGNQVVAGMLNGSIIPTSMGNVTNGNGIRIFAGSVPANGNVAECAFTVDNNGKVRAGSGSVIFNADGSGQFANGNVSWQTNGDVTILGTLQYNQAVGNVQIISQDTGSITLPNNSYFILVNGSVSNDPAAWPIIKLPENPVRGQILFIDLGTSRWFLEADQVIRYYRLDYDYQQSPHYSVSVHVTGDELGTRVNPSLAQWNGVVQFIYTGEYWYQIVHNIIVPNE